MVNPYQSPESMQAGESLRLSPLRSGARATLIAHGLLYRMLVIDAPIEATLTFHGRSLADTVSINHQVVAGPRSGCRKKYVVQDVRKLSANASTAPAAVGRRLMSHRRTDNPRRSIPGRSTRPPRWPTEINRGVPQARAQGTIPYTAPLRPRKMPA